MVRPEPFSKQRAEPAVAETTKEAGGWPEHREPPATARGEEPGVLVFVALVSISLMGPLALHIFLPALPHVKQAFAVDASAAQLAFSLAMVSMAVATLFYGSLSDRFGRLPMLQWGIGLFAAGASMATFAPSITVFIFGRVVQGAGAACGMVMARAIARDVYGEKRLGQVIAYLTAAYVVGPMFAPALGGLLTDAFGWQAILVVPALFGVLSMYASVAIMGETKLSPGFHSGGMMRGYVRLLRMPRFGLFAVSPAFATGGFLALNSGATYLMIEVLGKPATEFGLYFMLGPVGYVTGNFLSGRLSGRVSGNSLVVWGCVVALLGALSLVGFIGWFGLAPLCLFVPSGIVSLGQGLSMPHAQAAAIATEPSLTGTASGIVVFLKFFIGAVATQLVVASPDSLAVLLMVVVVAANSLSLLSGVVAVLMPEPRSPRPPRSF